MQTLIQDSGIRNKLTGKSIQKETINKIRLRNQQKIQINTFKIQIIVWFFIHFQKKASEFTWLNGLLQYENNSGQKTKRTASGIGMCLYSLIFYCTMLMCYQANSKNSRCFCRNPLSRLSILPC